MVDGWSVDRSRAAWWGIGAALGAAALFVVYSFIGTFVFGIFIYYATRPVYRRLRGRVGPPSLAAAIALLALALPAILLMVYTTAIGVQELTRAAQAASVTQLPPEIQSYANVSRIAQHPEQFLTNGNNTKLLQDAFDRTLRYVGFVGNGALHLFVMIALAFYLLRDDHKLSRWFRRTFADSDGVLEEYVNRVDSDFNGIFFGNILNALLTGTIGAISYNALDTVAPAGLSIPYPTLLGLLTGVASLIPVVGMKLVYFPLTIYVVVEALMARNPGLLWFPVAFFLVSLVIVDTIPDLVLRPYVSGRNLHIGMVMLAYILGPLLFGWYGIFLGPMLLVLVVHFAEIVLPELLAGRPIKPWAVDPTYLKDGPAEPMAQPPRDPEEGPAMGAADAPEEADALDSTEQWETAASDATDREEEQIEETDPETPTTPGERENWD